MSEETHQRSVRVAEGLAYVCRNLDSLHAVLPGDEQSPLRRLLAAMRADHDQAGPMEALHAALLAAGDPLGVWGHARSESRAVSIAGADGGRPFEPIYLCPQGRCSGRRVDKTTTFPLTCAITGQHLRRDHL